MNSIRNPAAGAIPTGGPSTSPGLGDIDYAEGRFDFNWQRTCAPASVLPGYLSQADDCAAVAVKRAAGRKGNGEAVLPAEAERLRWFPLPSEIADELAATVGPEADDAPIHPGR